jgi:hypothetical protein
MFSVAILIGAFYIFAGFIVMRSMAMSTLIDRVLLALDPKADSKSELLRSQVLLVGAYLTLASGVALLIMSPFAPYVFVLNTIVQGGYLIWAERAFPPEDAIDRQGRQRTKNAFVIYLAATAFVVWLAYQGVLRPWVGADVILLDLGVMALSLGLAWAVIYLPKRQEKKGSIFEPIEERPNGDVVPDIREEPPPKRLRVAPEWGCWPLWNDETGQNVSHFHLKLPEDLMARIEEWDDLWQATYNDDDPANGDFKSEDERSAYVVEGKAIIGELKRLWNGEVVVTSEMLK